VSAKRLPARAGAAWYICGWTLFRLAPVNWLLIAAVLTVLNLVALVPVVGPVLLLVITPALYGGAALAAREQASGGRPQVGHLLAALRGGQRRASMLRLGVLLLTVYLVALLIGSFALGTVAGMMGIELVPPDLQTAPRPEDLSEDALMLVLVMLALVQAIVGAVFFFAVPLVMFRGLTPGAAVKTGVGAVVANFGALFVFLLVNAGMGALVVAGAMSLPPLIALLLVAVSISLAAWYCAFRSVFEDDGAPAALAA